MYNNNHTIRALCKSACLLVLFFGLVACQTQAPKKEVSKEIIGQLQIKMQDMSYEPAKLNVAKAGHYRINIQNTSAVPHDIEFADGTKLNVAPKKSASIEIDVPASGILYRCTLPGHEQAGMKGKITVNNQEPNDTAQHEQHEKSTANIKPEYYDPVAPKLLPGKVHDIELIAEEKDIAVAKEGVQNLWTFNGKVPGPMIRVKVGDTVRVHLKNPTTNKLQHSVDFHASQAAWNDEMTSINPGEEKLYEWRADYAGVWMYHCGSNPALHHIASGMYGMVIVEPREGLPKVDHEFAIVQSEFYMGKAGGITDLHKAGASHGPDYVVFNGVAFQYKDHPIEVGTGKKVRMYVLNAGPNEDSSFHIVGTIFSHVIKEGMELVPENKGHYGSQAVDLGPAQGAIIEFTTAEDGLYPIVTHAFNFVGKGALGLLKAGDGDSKN